MDLLRIKLKTCAFLLLYVAWSRGEFVEPAQPDTSLRSTADSQTRLPCKYRPGSDEKVVQVTWYKGLGQSKEQIITAHFTDGHTEFGRFAGRVRFESSSPTENSALLIPSTEMSDEGVFTCHISTFPNGNFERTISLTVWSLPISSLDPVVMREGQSFGPAASCRSVGRPAPRITWDTPLAGQVQNRSSSSGAVSSLFSIYPYRDMNGKRLDCLVWHPGLERPRRISNTLEVQYPPHVKISADSGPWFEGMEHATLVCDAQGQPRVSNITWTWKGGALPDGAQATEDKLLFARALRLNDSGVYQCVALNAVGPGSTEYEITVKERSLRLADITSDTFLLMMVGAGGGLLLLMMILVIVLVNRHHRNKHRRLKMELSEKTDEINSLSRQTSLRRVNSVSSDPRAQERPRYKESQETVTGNWGPPGGVELDELGRPVVWSERDLDSEKRRRVESFLKSSNMSLDSGLPSSLVPLKPQPDEGVAPCRDGELPHLRHAPNPEPWGASGPGRADDEDEEDEEDEDYQLSEALHNHFYLSKGQLRPRPHSNAVLLQPGRPGSAPPQHGPAPLQHGPAPLQPARPGSSLRSHDA